MTCKLLSCLEHCQLVVQSHQTKVLHCRWPIAGVPAPECPKVCPSQASQTSADQALSRPGTSPAADFLPTAVPPVVTEANLTRGRGWNNRRRSLQVMPN